MAKNKKEKNPIAERSKKWIVSALLKLMKTKPYEEITVQEISDEADLVRRTFYRNCTSKNAILSYISDQMAESFTERLSERGTVTIIGMVQVFFALCSEHMDFLINLKQNNLWYFSAKQYDEIYDFILKTMRQEEAYHYPEEYIEYYAEYITGGLWKVFCRWVGDGAVKSPDEMTEFVSDLVDRMRVAYPHK